VSEAIAAERPALAETSAVGGAEQILTEESLGFLAALHRRFETRRQALLASRAERQRAFDSGALPDFLPETADIRDGDWPQRLRDGGMAAQIPVKGDEAANEIAFAKVRADKEREARNGHDGT